MWEWQAVESGVGYICASKRQEHMDTPGGGREELAQGRPRPACRYEDLVVGEEGLLERAWMGLPSSTNAQTCCSLDPSPTLGGKDIFGSDFRLSLLKLVGSICQAA